MAVNAPFEERIENLLQRLPEENQDAFRTRLRELREQLGEDVFRARIDEIFLAMAPPPPNPFPPTAPALYTNYLERLGDRVIGDHAGNDTMPKLSEVSFNDVVNIPGFYLVVRPVSEGRFEQFLIYTHHPRVREEHDRRLIPHLGTRRLVGELYAARRPGEAWMIFGGHHEWGISNTSKFYTLSPIDRRRHALAAWGMRRRIPGLMAAAAAPAVANKAAAPRTRRSRRARRTTRRR